MFWLITLVLLGVIRLILIRWVVLSSFSWLSPSFACSLGSCALALGFASGVKFEINSRNLIYLHIHVHRFSLFESNLITKTYYIYMT